ncbi:MULTISPECIES: TonB-dependent receptor plug domain-containing protein [unclassified Sphingomonas]|uniref:Outer Membrane receptor protein n=1 Tax=Sphingomonas sp. SH TaxID=849864 RepID=A0A109PLU0_9SPHN|nr:TonB-dependent receptor plug domain-containing protein [Sphingomonas sp. SRS2]ALZ45866.1 Outer Membrane receptor protein [Sphingomonas sp. SH]
MLSPTAAAESIETIIVEGRKINLVGDAISASQGVIGQHEIALRPLLRTGEVLEMVPGMVVTQHSGTGKANQYYLRGFNLDHGTDFATSIDSMPLNMRTHGHGQGYTDLSPLIPELVEKITYKKGPYYADIGDFSGAGSANIITLNYLDKGLVEVTAGEGGYDRLVAMDSVTIDQGELLYALEANRYDGPWSDIEEDLKKINLLLKYSHPLKDGLLAITLMGYDNSWNSADQIPARAVANGLIDELGSIDNTTGGESSRYSLSASWQDDQLNVSAYAIQYDLSLWSNFTYFLSDPSNGDQFEQVGLCTLFGHRFTVAA